MIDWKSLLIPDTPPLEMIVRGSVMYLTIFFLLRFLLKRESGTTGVTDLLVIVLIADAAQNGMANDYTTIADGMILVLTIIGWACLLDLLAYRWPAAARLIRPSPLLLVRDGQVMRRNMRRELISQEELFTQLREQGIDDLATVKEVRMEPDGRFSVITHSGSQPRNNPDDRATF